MSRHTLSVLVEDKPGVLARVASLFSRRGFNIESLAVGPTEVPQVSRMTIVVNVDRLPLEQVTKQLNKLINVLKIVELEEESSVQREIMLVKVKATDIKLLTGVWKIDPAEVLLKRMLASGAEGEVWFGSYQSRWKVAIKKIKGKDTKSTASSGVNVTTPMTKKKSQNFR